MSIQFLAPQPFRKGEPILLVSEILFFGSLSPQQSNTTLTLLPMSYQSVCQSFTPPLSHSWTKPSHGRIEVKTPTLEKETTAPMQEFGSIVRAAFRGAPNHIKFVYLHLLH